MTASVTPINNKTMADLAKAQAAPPLSRWQRIKRIAIKFWIKGWGKLNFGIVNFPPMQLVDKGAHKFAREYIGTDVRIKLSLYERLQLIISGRLVIRQSMLTWPKVKRSMSKTAISVLPPGIE